MPFKQKRLSNTHPNNMLTLNYQTLNIIQNKKFNLLIPYFINIYNAKNKEEAKYYLKSVYSINNDCQTSHDIVEHISNMTLNDSIKLFKKNNEILSRLNLEDTRVGKSIKNNNTPIKRSAKRKHLLGGTKNFYINRRGVKINVDEDMIFKEQKTSKKQNADEYKKFINILNDIINENKTYNFKHRSLSIFKIIIKIKILKKKLEHLKLYSLDTPIDNLEKRDIIEKINKKFNYYHDKNDSNIEEV